jgi:hypothetical protein
VKNSTLIGTCVGYVEYYTNATGFVSDEDTIRRLRGKLCRVNPMSASGMKQGHRVV